MIYIAPPHGDFFIEAEAETPITLISAGVGQTPILSMLHALHDSQHQAEIHWLHAAENGAVHAFAGEVADIAGRMPHLNRHIWYRQPGADNVEKRNYHRQGLMDLNALSDALSNPQMHYYFCGPVPRSCST